MRSPECAARPTEAEQGGDEHEGADTGHNLKRIHGGGSRLIAREEWWRRAADNKTRGLRLGEIDQKVLRRAQQPCVAAVHDKGSVRGTLSRRT